MRWRMRLVEKASRPARRARRRRGPLGGSSRPLGDIRLSKTRVRKLSFTARGTLKGYRTKAEMPERPKSDHPNLGVLTQSCTTSAWARPTT
jgi:hypothetical protein